MNLVDWLLSRGGECRGFWTRQWCSQGRWRRNGGESGRRIESKERAVQSIGAGLSQWLSRASSFVHRRRSGYGPKCSRLTGVNRETDANKGRRSSNIVGCPFGISNPSSNPSMASTSATSSTSQPIALPIVHSNSSGSYVDYQMADGSYTSSSGPFNPASYTRHFLGSPISWRGSSFNAASFNHRVPEHSFQGSIEYVSIRFARYRALTRF